jgi:hypothetical protein
MSENVQLYILGEKVLCPECFGKDISKGESAVTLHDEVDLTKLNKAKREANTGEKVIKCDGCGEWFLLDDDLDSGA